MQALISVFLLHLYFFGYIGAALGSDQTCGIPTSDDSEFETVELIFREGDLEKKLSDPKIQKYLRKHFADNSGSCEEQETTTTITTTVTTGSTQPPTKTTDEDGKGTQTPVETTTSATTPRGDTTKTSAPTTQGTSTQPEATTSYLEETTTQPTTTMPKTTTDSPASTTEIRIETIKETTTEEPITVTPTCAPLNKTAHCDIVYDRKCFFFSDDLGQSVKLQNAAKYCEDHGAQLGNIYDDCHYQYILEAIGNRKINHWTAMKIAFSTPEKFHVILRSGMTTEFEKEWWLDNNPEYGIGSHLLIFSPLSFLTKSRAGFKNSAGDQSMDGAFCEEDLP